MSPAGGILPWTVVTVTYNSADLLRRCWTGPKPYDWLVVDNDSTDDSVATAERLGARVVRLRENVGFSRANNVGLREAGQPYVLFANPDLVADPADLPRLAGHLDRFGGLVGPQLLGPDGHMQPNGRGFPYVTAKLGNRKLWPFARLHAGYRLLTHPQEARWVSWLTGAAIAARREDFADLGGWNEKFFLYYEDTEVCLRAWRHGMPVALLGEVRWVHHWARATNTFRWSRAHTLEIQSARTFYGMFPEFLVGVPRVAKRHSDAARHCGQPIPYTPQLPRQRSGTVYRSSTYQG